MAPYLALYPRTNGPDNGDGSAKLFFADPQPIDEDFYMVKVDHRFSDSDDFFVRYTVDDGASSSLQESAVYTRTEENLNQYLTIEEKHIFSPSLLNEFRFAFNRSSSRTDEVGPVDESLWFVDPARQQATGFEGGMGLISARSSGFSQFGTSTRTPQKHVLNTFQYMDNLVWNRGRHALKMGVSFSRFQYNAANFARLQGTYSFNTNVDFLNASPNGATVNSQGHQPLVSGFNSVLLTPKG